MPNETQRAKDLKRALLNAQYDIQRRLEKINWRHDVLLPELEAVQQAGAVATTAVTELTEGLDNGTADDAATDQDA